PRMVLELGRCAWSSAGEVERREGVRDIEVRVGRTVAQVEQTGQPEGPELLVPDPHYAGWSDEDVAAEYAKVGAEHYRRGVQAEAAQTVDRAAVAFQAASGVSDGDPWERPVKVGYPAGATATHDGRTWVNLVPNNFHEPGVS